MGIQLSLETELRLATEARRQGISVDAMLKRFVEEQAARAMPPRPDLPVWSLGAVGALHRHDLYNDAG